MVWIGNKALIPMNFNNSAQCLEDYNILYHQVSQLQEQRIMRRHDEPEQDIKSFTGQSISKGEGNVMNINIYIISIIIKII